MIRVTLQKFGKVILWAHFGQAVRNFFLNLTNEAFIKYFTFYYNLYKVFKVLTLSYQSYVPMYFVLRLKEIIASKILIP